MDNNRKSAHALLVFRFVQNQIQMKQKLKTTAKTKIMNGQIEALWK